MKTLEQIHGTTVNEGTYQTYYVKFPNGGSYTSTSNEVLSDPFECIVTDSFGDQYHAIFDL